MAHRPRFVAVQAEAPRQRRTWPLFRSLAGYPRSWPRGDAIAGLLRLGFLANFISEPVLKGFIIGLALTVIIGQVPKLLGIDKGEGDFFEQLRHVLSHLGDASGVTVVVGLLSLAAVLGLRSWLPIVPGSLVAVILGVAAVAARCRGW